MHSRLGHHGDHGHRCHGMEHGRLGGCNRDSFDNLGLGGLAGGGRPLHGSRNLLGRDGDRFGWGREGRVRLDDFPMRQRRQGSMGGLLGGLGSLNLGRGGLGGGLGGGGGLLDGMDDLGGLGGRGPMRGGPLDGFGARGPPLNGGFVHPDDTYEALRWDGNLGGMGGWGRLGGGLLSPGGMGLGIGLGGEGVGRQAGVSRAPSLRGSNYSLEHLDRRARPYHYQPPYVEDWESILEEELLGSDMMGVLERRDGMMQGADLYGLPGGYDTEDLMGGAGGLGGRRGRL